MTDWFPVITGRPLLDAWLSLSAASALLFVRDGIIWTIRKAVAWLRARRA